MLLAIAQLDTSNLVPGDAARRLLDSARIAADAGARIMVCPYASLMHPIPPDASDQMDYVIEVAEALALLSREAPLPLLCCGPDVLGGFAGNLAFYIHDGLVEPVGVGARAGEAPGEEVALTLDGVRMVVASTHDDLDFLIENKTDADIVVFADAIGFCPADPLSAMGSGFLEGTLSGLAQELDAWFVGAASLGGYGEDVYCGASFVVTPWGELAARAPGFEESLLIYDIDVRSEGPLEAPAEPDYYDRPLMVWLALSLGLADLLRVKGLEGVLLPLDGGLISSLLCVLASDALGPKRVHAVMPATADPERSMRADTLAHTLGVVRHAPDARLNMPLSEEGLKGRVRIELARLSGKLKALPLLCLDKTALCLEPERMMDGLGWLAPLGDVYRLDLVELARMRNTISPVIPRVCVRDYEVPAIDGLDDAAASGRGLLEFADMVMSGRVEGMRAPVELAKSFGQPKAVEALMRRFCDAAPYRAGVSVIRVSARAAGDVLQPLGLAWQNSVGNEPAMGRIEAIMSKLMAAEESQEAKPPQAGEMLNLLQDIAETPQMGPQRPFPFGWGIPFSEN